MKELGRNARYFIDAAGDRFRAGSRNENAPPNGEAWKKARYSFAKGAQVHLSWPRYRLYTGYLSYEQMLGRVLTGDPRSSELATRLATIRGDRVSSAHPHPTGR